MALFAVATLTVALTGCEAIDAALGPSCQDFKEASDVEKQEMVLDWMKDEGLAAEDATMTSQGSGLGPIGFEVMGFVNSFDQECADRGDSDRLSDFSVF